MKTPTIGTCKSCRGLGRVTVATRPPIEIECSICSGAGRGEYVEVACASCQGARGLPCARCIGSGRVAVFRPSAN